MSDFVTYDETNAPEAAQSMLIASKEKYGTVLNLFGNMAESPALLDAYLTLSDIFQKSALTVEQQLVVLLAVSRFNECHYCMAAHTGGGKMAGIDDSVAEAIREDDVISDPELEVLRKFVNHLLEKRGWADPEKVAELLAAGYSKEQMLDVIVGVGMKTLSNYTNHILGTELDGLLQPYEWHPNA